MEYDQENHLKIIQRKFLAKLQENIEPFQEFLSEISNENPSIPECTQIRSIIHQIAGSGKTFGFDSISKHASAIEEQLDNIIENKQQDSTTLKTLELELNKLIKISQELISNINKEFVNEVSEGENSNAEKEYKHTIFIADDDNLVTELVSNYLASLKIKVISASDGKNALDIITNSIPELIILDVNLPKIKGFDVLKQLKESATTKYIPVIMLTKLDNDKSVIEGISKGAIEYITKPFEIEELSSKITSCLKSHNTKILIADDDKLICELLKLRFQKIGYTVLTVHNGDEALRVYKEQKPNIVILDIMMPGVDGMAVLGQINDETPVIMLTAKSQHDNVMIALEKGAYDYITKPFNADELVAKVQGVLKRSRKDNN